MTPSGHEQDHSDPYGFFAEVPPKTASIVWPLTNYQWGDSVWMEHRAQTELAPRAGFYVRGASGIVAARSVE